ncbi:flavodoxin family protein [Alphaproteobacteria bacterium LSUCC0684]
MSSPTVLFISHAPSANTLRLRQGAVTRITDETDVELITKPPLEAGAGDVLAADAVLIGTTENIGYMAGATKDFFDRSYNDLLEVKAGLPVAVYIRAGLDGTGSRRAIEAILTGLRWRLVAPPLILHGAWQDSFVPATEELALTLAAGVELGLF